MGSWYYVDGGQNRQGPVSAEALAEAWRMGQVDQDSLVWRDGLSEWVPLGQFRDELGLANVAPAPPMAAVVQARKNNGCLIAVAVVVGGGLFLVFTLGILAAIALPAYQDYVIRSKLATVRVEGQAAKLAIEEFRANTDRCPRDAAELGLPAPSTPGLVSLDVGALADGRCMVDLTLGTLGTYTAASGGRLRMAREEDGTWSCSAEGIPAKLLPSDCR